MLRLVKTINKHVNELTPDELKELDWASVPNSQYSTMRHDLLLLVTDMDKVFENIPCEDIENGLALKVIKRALGNGTTNHFKDLILREIVDEWCTVEFIQKNFGFFQRLRDKGCYQYFELALAQKGIINLNTINVSYDIVDWYILNDNRIGQDSLFQYLKDTNHLAVSIGEIPDYTPICLPDEMLKELRLPYPGDCWISKSEYLIDAPVASLGKDLVHLSDKIYWKDALDLYRKGVIEYDTVSCIWCDIFDEHPHLVEEAGLFSTTFMRPGRDMSRTRGFK